MTAQCHLPRRAGTPAHRLGQSSGCPAPRRRRVGCPSSSFKPNLGFRIAIPMFGPAWLGPPSLGVSWSSYDAFLLEFSYMNSKASSGSGIPSHPNSVMAHLPSLNSTLSNHTSMILAAQLPKLVPFWIRRVCAGFAWIHSSPSGPAIANHILFLCLKNLSNALLHVISSQCEKHMCSLRLSGAREHAPQGHVLTMGHGKYSFVLPLLCDFKMCKINVIAGLTRIPHIITRLPCSTCRDPRWQDMTIYIAANSRCCQARRHLGVADLVLGAIAPLSSNPTVLLAVFLYWTCYYDLYTHYLDNAFFKLLYRCTNPDLNKH
jgi:hypothetical protein